MPSQLRWLTVLLLPVSLVLPARAQQSPLSQVPDSPIVVHLRGWEHTVDRVKATLKASLPDYGELITGQIDRAISDALNGRELKGLAKEGPMFIVFTEVPTSSEETPDIAVMVRVTNYVQFRDAYLKEEERNNLKADKAGFETASMGDKKMYWLNRGEYAVITISEKSLKKFQDKKSATVESRIAKPFAEKLLGADLSAFVDMKAVYKQHGDQMANARGFVDQAIQAAQGMGGVDKTQVEQAKKILESMFQLVEDTEQLVASVDFRPEGFMLRTYVQVAEKSPSNVYLKTVKPAALTGIGKLPAGAMVYSNSSSNLELAQGLLSSMLGLGGGGGDAKSTKAAEEALAEMTGLKFEESYSSYDFPSGGINVIRYADPAKAVAASLKLYQAIPENAAFGGSALKGKPEVKPNEQSVGGFSLHGVKLNWDIDRMVERFPEELREGMKETMKKLLGHGQRIWFGTDGKAFVQVTAKDWTEGKKRLDEYLSGRATMGASAEFAATRKQLPAETNTLVLLDAGRMAHAIGQYIGEILKNFPALPFNLGAAGKPEGKPSYIGFAMTLQPRQGGIDLFLPAEAVKQIFTVLKPLFGGLDSE